MKKSFTKLCLLSAVLFIATSCKKSNNDDNTPVYDIPTTYNFTNVNYDDANTRLGMVTEMGTIMKNATGAIGALDGTKLKAMFSNTGNQFTTAGYNTSGLQVKDQCAAQLQIDVLAMIDSLVLVNNSGKVASSGVAGIGVSGTSKYALTASGVNYAQVFNKCIMGGLISYQIANNYMTAAINGSLDNSTVVAGKGTAMEHNWDLAFGYWGVPIDFPTNKVGAKLWGSYTTQVDAGYKVNDLLMGAFLKGRAAISNKDDKTRKEQATIILQAFERVVGAAALQEVKEAKDAIADPILLNSRLSECYGFVSSLKYNPKRTITDTQLAVLLSKFPKNFYNVTITDINNIRDAVAAQYNFNDVKDIL